MSDVPEADLKKACEAQIQMNEERKNRGQHLLIRPPLGITLRDFYKAAKMNFDSRGEALSETDRVNISVPQRFSLPVSMKKHGAVRLAAFLPEISDQQIEKWFDVEPGSTTLCLVKGWKFILIFQHYNSLLLLKSVALWSLMDFNRGMILMEIWSPGQKTRGQ